MLQDGKDNIQSLTQTLEVEHHYEKLKQLCKSVKSSICTEVLQNTHVPSSNEQHNFELEGPVQIHKRTLTTSHKMDNWEIIQGDQIYMARNRQPSQTVLETGRHDEFQQVHKEAVLALNKIYNAPFTLVRVLNCYVRYRSKVGHEYIVDLLVRNQNNQQVEQQRVSLMRQEESKFILVRDSSTEVLRKPINIVVPAHDVVKRLKTFLKSYETACLKEDGKCKLHIVMYNDNEIKAMTGYLEQIKHRYPYFQYNIVQGTGEFSRSRARHFGMSSLQEDDLAFMVDVDIDFDKDFLRRCRQNTIQDERVYFPIVFKYYNMEFVHPDQPPKSHYDITVQNGYWCKVGYGVVCMYKSDYSKIGGFSSKFTVWGGEDTDLFEKSQHKFEIFRVPDPGVVHHFHFNNCSSLPRNRQMGCYGSRNDGLADQIQLADYVYKVKYNNI